MTQQLLRQSTVSEQVLREQKEDSATEFTVDTVSQREITVTGERTTLTADATMTQTGSGEEKTITIDEETETWSHRITRINAAYDRFRMTPLEQLQQAFETDTDAAQIRTAHALTQIAQQTALHIAATDTTTADISTPAPTGETRDTPPTSDSTAYTDHFSLTRQPGLLATDPSVDAATAEQRYEYGAPDTAPDPLPSPVPDTDGAAGTTETQQERATSAAPERAMPYSHEAAVLDRPAAAVTAYDPDATEAGTRQKLSYTVSIEQSGNAAEALQQLFAQTDISGDVEKMSYQDTDDGMKTKEAYWVDIDGMTMERTEFFINGELAEDGLGKYELAPGDTLTFVESDIFAGDTENCGGSLYLDDVTTDTAATDTYTPSPVLGAEALSDITQTPYLRTDAA